MTGEQVKQIRVALGLSQTEYGERFGASRDMVANMENGRVEVKDYISRHIMTVFHINESWIDTGKGDMFENFDDNFVSELASKYQLNDFQQTLVRAVYEMPPELQDMVMEVARKLVSEAAAPPERVETEYERMTRIVNDKLDDLEDEKAAAATDTGA